MSHCIDTSSLIHAWARAYPPANFPGIWRDLEGLIASGTLVAPDEVKGEIAKMDDDLRAWSKEHDQLFLPLIPEVQTHAKVVLRSFPRLVDTRRGRNPADPFVIGLAMHRGFTVVTNELPTGKVSKPNIPDVCLELKVPCINLLGLIQVKGWTYS